MTLQRLNSLKKLRNSFKSSLFRSNAGDHSPTETPWGSQLQQTASMATLIMLMGVYGISAQNAQAHLVELAQLTESSTQFTESPLTDQATAVLPRVTSSTQSDIGRVANGVYLFGDTTTAGQSNHEYMVLQVTDNSVTGGFYEPGHSFSCFSGTVTSQQLDIEVQDPQRPDHGRYQVPIYLDQPAATSRFVLPYENTLGLQGTYRIETLEAESQRILNFCRRSQAMSQQFEPTYSFLTPGSVVPMARLTH